MNKGLKKVLSYTLITTMVASMALTGFGGGARTVKAATTTGESLQDSATQINYSTVLGRGIDFGILADTYDQGSSHSETNMAVKKYKINGQSTNDPDLAGGNPISYIIGSIEGADSETKGQLKIANPPTAILNGNKMTVNIETTATIIANSTPANPALANNPYKTPNNNIFIKGNDSGQAPEGGREDRDIFELVYRTASQEDINTNVGLMIEHIQDESNKFKDKSTEGVVITAESNGEKVEIDLSDSKYDGKVVYIQVKDVPDPGEGQDRTLYKLYQSLSKDNYLTIKKRESTVVVLNVEGGKTESKPLSLAAYNVLLVDDQQNETELRSNSHQYQSSGVDSAINLEIDKQICKKIIWNLYEAKSASITNSAGTFLVNKEDSTTKVKNSAGWLASAGTVYSEGEWHFINRDRAANVGSYEDGVMHFALKKALATQLDDNTSRKTVEDNYKVTTVDIDEVYQFQLYKAADSNYSNLTAVGSPITNDDNSKVILPDLTFTDSDVDNDYYYVIKEVSPTSSVNVSSGTISNSTGLIKIKLHVYKENDTIKFKVYSNYYLKESYNFSAKENDNDNGDKTGIKMTGNEFSLGDFYNLYTETPTGDLKISKTQATGSDPIADDEEFTINVTATESDGTPLAGTYTTNITPGNTAGSVTFTAGAASVTLKKGETITISGLVEGTKITGVSETLSAAQTGYYTSAITPSNIATSNIEIETDTTKAITVANKYTAPKGDLVITKTYAGITEGQIPNPTQNLLQVSNEQGITQALLNWGDGTGTGLTKTFTVSDLPIGTYHVKEIRQNQTISGYGLEVGAKVNNITQSLGADCGVDATVVESPVDTQVDFTNTYVQNGSITVTKTVDGLEGTASLPSDYVIEYFDGTTKMGELTTNVDCSGAGTTSNPFTWTVDDVPAGKTVTFVESNYAVTGYDLAITTTPAAVANEDNKVVSAAVPEGGNTTVAFTNTYTRQKTNATLEKQWVINTSGSVADEITVKLLANGTQVGNDIVLHKDGTTNGSGTLTVSSDEKTWTYAVNDLNKYDDAGQLISYTWEEVIPTNANYELSNVPVADSNNVTTFINTSPVAGKVTVNIKKVLSITGDNAPFANKKYYVQILGEDGNYYNTSGAIVLAANSRVEINTASNVSVSLPTGQKYTITEETASQTNYTWTHSYAIGSTTVSTCEIDVTDSSYNNTTYSDLITVTNTYVECGSVEIEKVASGDPFPANAPSFPISISFDADGTYTVAEYPLGGAQHAAPVDFTANTAVTYNLHAGDKVVVFGVPAGVEYTVSEGDISALTDYAKVGISGDVDTNGKGTITSGTQKEVDVTNSYTTPVIQTGSIKVSKVEANGSDPIPAAAAFPITVTFNDTSDVTYQVSVNGGTAQNVSFAAADTHAVTQNIKVGDFFEISGVPQGVTYTVTENLTGLTDYVAPNITSGSGSISGTQVDATVANTYTAQATTPTNITVNFSKRETGKTEELPGATLQLLNGTTSVSQFQSGTSPVPINNLGAGTYTLKELVPPTDYQCAADITFTIEDDGTNTGTLIVKDANGVEIQDKTIVMYDAKVPMKEVSFSKVSIGNIGKIAGAKLTLYSVGANGVLTKKIDWTSSETDVYKFTLAAGDYAIEETVAPEGYVKATSLVKFNLSFDTNGNAVIKVTEGPGEYDATNDVILIKNDPIKVTGKLSVHVEEKKTGRPVPDAEVEVTGPDGTTKTYKTNGDGEIVDVNGNTPIDVPAGTYKIKIKSVPKGYDVDTGEVGDVTVPENGEGRHIAKIVSSTGGLKIKVLEEGTNREVPDATVVVEAPEGVKFPDGSTKITAITDKNGNITTYTGADGKTYDLTSGLTPGDYKITVTKVPAGYQVTTGETKTCKVVKDEVAEHVALIATSSNVQPAPAPAPAPAATPASTPATSTGSITNSINVKTGDDMNVYPALIAMALSIFAGASVLVFRKKKETK